MRRSSKIGLDGYTAFVALTHDPKIDDPGLEAALRSDCFYIGALGSRKTHGSRVERLIAAGFDEATLAAHPRADRARYRRRLAGRDRAGHSRRDRQHIARKPRRRRAP